MSFTADYCTAYRLLRSGSPDPALRNIICSLPSDTDGRHQSMRFSDALKAIFNVNTTSQARVLRPLNQLKAVIFAFSVAKEMRRQRALVRDLFDIKEEPPVKIVHQKDITLFPITINKTNVQMVKQEDV